MSDMLLPYTLPNHSPLHTVGALAPVRHGTQFLRLGSRGEPVAIVQQALHGIAAKMPITTDHGRRLPDGIFGQETLAVVRRFQSATCLEADGIVGPKTMAKLDQVSADCGLSTLITVSHALIKAIQEQPAVSCSIEVVPSLATLQDELRPFDRGLWEDAYIHAHIKRIESQLRVGQSSTSSTPTFASAVPIPVPPQVLLLFALGVVAVHVIGTTNIRPKLPDFTGTPPVTAVGGITGAAIAILLVQLQNKAREFLTIALGWALTIDEYRKSQDPKCRKAVQKAVEAVKELKHRIHSILNLTAIQIAGKDINYFSRELFPGLLRLFNKAAAAMLEMARACYV